MKVVGRKRRGKEANWVTTSYFCLNIIPCFPNCNTENTYSTSVIRFAFALAFFCVCYGQSVQISCITSPKRPLKLPFHLYWSDGNLSSNHYTPEPLQLHFHLTLLLSSISFPISTKYCCQNEVRFLTLLKPCLCSLSLIKEIQILYNWFSGIFGWVFFSCNSDKLRSVAVCAVSTSVTIVADCVAISSNADSKFKFIFFSELSEFTLYILL